MTPASTTTQPRIVTTLPQGWKAFDLHLHTHRSLDAFTTVDRVLEIARAKGIGLAITDHNEIRGAVEAIERAKDVVVIPAIEVKARDGVDIMVYFNKPEDMEDYYRRVIEPKQANHCRFIPDLSEREIVEGAERLGAVLSSPHPYAPDRMGLAGVTDSGAVRGDLLERMHVIEVANSMMSRKANAQAITLAEKLGKPGIGGSDAHVPWAIGGSVTVLEQRPGEGPLQALRDGRCAGMGTSDGRLLSGLVFVAGQIKVSLQPDGWNLIRRNLRVFLNHAMRDGRQPEPA